MFRVREGTDERWIESYDEEDGSFTENWNTGIAERSQPHCESMSEPSIVGGASTGKKGGRVYGSNPTDPT
jgi:hypothetical protein